MRALAALTHVDHWHTIRCQLPPVPPTPYKRSDDIRRAAQVLTAAEQAWLVPDTSVLGA